MRGKRPGNFADAESLIDDLFVRFAEGRKLWTNLAIGSRNLAQIVRIVLSSVH